MSEQIVIDVSPSGVVNIELNGFEGTTCMDATEQLEIVIGGQGTKKKDFKPEFSMPASTNQENKSVF
jgi:hypothetical protein